MAHNYWWNNALNEKTTITKFALDMDTNDINSGMNSGDNKLDYQTFLSDETDGVRKNTPGFPWSSNYESAFLWRDINHPPTVNERSAYFGEIRAGRPTKVGIPGHATLGIDYQPSSGALVNDPWDGTAKLEEWNNVRNFVSQQPHALPDEPAGDRVLFSNDNFGTGQANAQAPGGDPGDIFGSSLNGSYGRVLDDVPAGLSSQDATHRDYNANNVTSGLENPFDIDAMDVLKTIQPMKTLIYSLDHGDPNPHDWIPGVQEGSASYQPQELYAVPLFTPWFTTGYVKGHLDSVTATEDQLGLNRAEWSLPGDPLDDDVDAVELEFDPNWFFYSVDYVDTRVFPEYTANKGANWYELPEYDPTDIYWNGSVFIDGETQVFLADGTDIDAIQFFSLTDAFFKIDGLLFSIDSSLDAPDYRDALGSVLDPGTIYLSWLNGSAPIPYAYIGSDIDALTWVPEPSTLGLVGIGLLGLVRIRMRHVLQAKLALGRRSD